MYIVVYAQNNYNEARTVIETVRQYSPAYINKLVLVDVNSSDGLRVWAGEQTDFTYVYFDESITPGKAFNEVIEGLELRDDILFCDSNYVFLPGCIERLERLMESDRDIFAAGVVAPVFEGMQNHYFDSFEDACDWSVAQDNGIKSIDTMLLHGGVITINSKYIEMRVLFDEEIADLENLFLEYQLRAFLKHNRIVISLNSAVWDLRGNDHLVIRDTGCDVIKNKYGMHYLNTDGNPHLIDIVSELSSPDDKIRILEIGCDCGGTLFRLKQIFPNASVYGTDINEAALRMASVFATVKESDIQKLDLDFGENDFDYILFGDVLEHLRNPLDVLKYCRKMMAPNGRIVASIPNIMHISVMKDLLDGHFIYKDSGIMDRTHIHMFTYNEIRSMFETDAGFNIYEITGVRTTNEETEAERVLIEKLLALSNETDRFMYDTAQYLVVAGN